MQVTTEILLCAKHLMLTISSLAVNGQFKHIFGLLFYKSDPKMSLLLFQSNKDIHTVKIQYPCYSQNVIICRVHP